MMSLEVSCSSIATYKSSPTISGDEFDDADFAVGRNGHPDEVALDVSVSSENFDRRISLGRKAQPPIAQLTKSNPIPQMRQTSDRLQHTSLVPAGPQTPVQSRTTTVVATSKPIEDQSKPRNIPRPSPAPPFQHQSNPTMNVSQRFMVPPPAPGLSAANGETRSSPHSPEPPGIKKANSETLSSTESSSMGDHEAPVGFFAVKMPVSIKSASDEVPLKIAPFNPHLESPSIRKTAGIDHTKSKPVGRENPGAPLVALPPKTNFVNPQADKVRRVGMPVAVGSPLHNRNSYKAPTMKRPAEGIPMP